LHDQLFRAKYEQKLTVAAEYMSAADAGDADMGDAEAGDAYDVDAKETICSSNNIRLVRKNIHFFFRTK
jgi:hypothetical protein